MLPFTEAQEWPLYTTSRIFVFRRATLSVRARDHNATLISYFDNYQRDAIVAGVVVGVVMMRRDHDENATITH